MRPRFKSYGESSTATLSPGRMRMKFFRILPETCASTWCLFSNSTRNMALGRGSKTTAITSIASSLLIDSLKTFSPRLWALANNQKLRPSASLLRQNDRPIFRHCHAMLEMGAETTIRRYCGPFVAQDPRFRLAEINHRFDGQHHAFAQLGAVASIPEIGYLGLFVQPRSDAMPDKLPHYAEAVGFYMLLDGGAHITHRIAHSRLRDATIERSLGDFQQFSQLRLYRFTHRNRNRGIPIIAVEHHPAVKGNDVALFQDAFLRRNAVHNLFIHRRAQHAWIIVISLESRLRSQFLDFLFGGALQIHRGHTGSDQSSHIVQNLTHYAPALSHLFNLCRRFTHDRHSYAC